MFVMTTLCRLFSVRDDQLMYIAVVSDTLLVYIFYSHVGQFMHTSDVRDGRPQHTGDVRHDEFTYVV